MRILLVHNFYRVPGGEDTVFNNEKDLLEAHGHEVITFTRDNHDMKPWHLLKDAVYSDKTYKEVSAVIREKRPDIVHVHNTQFLVSASVFKAAKDAGVPVFQTLHNFRTICLNAMLQRDGKLCSECCPSVDFKELTGLSVDCGNSNCAEKCTGTTHSRSVGENSVPSKNEGGFHFEKGAAYSCYRNSKLYSVLSRRIHEETIRRDLYKDVNLICLTELNRNIMLQSGLTDESHLFVKPNFTVLKSDSAISGVKNPHQFIFLGRLDPLKGIEDILEQWKNVPETDTLLVCGSGDASYEEMLREKYGSISNVRFMGNVAHDEALKLLAESSALIFASTWLEGFPMTLIESFFSGTPVLAVDFGNGGDIVSKIYGSKEPLMKDIAELPARISSFAEDSEKGRYSYDKDRLKDFTPDKNYELLMEIYDLCLLSHKGV